MQQSLQSLLKMAKTHFCKIVHDILNNFLINEIQWHTTEMQTIQSLIKLLLDWRKGVASVGRYEASAFLAVFIQAL